MRCSLRRGIDETESGLDEAFRRLTPAQESLFLTLYLRALDSRSTTPILADEVSRRIADEIDYDFSRQRVWRSLVLNLALRTKTLDDLVRAFAIAHPDAAVLDLGCGLDPRVVRCDLPDGTDWYDIDYPVVVDIRERYLPNASTTIGADLTSPGWMKGIPADRPTMIVADGLMAFLSGPAYKAMLRNLTGHFATGELAFNAYASLVLKLANVSSTFRAFQARTAGEGIGDPREAERWGARLTLVQELLLVRASEVARFPQPQRALARLRARSTRIARQGNRILHYRF